MSIPHTRSEYRDTRVVQITVRIPMACRMTGIGRSKLYELIQAGEIEVVKVGTMTLVPVASLEAFIARHRANRRSESHLCDLGASEFDA